MGGVGGLVWGGRMAWLDLRGGFWVDGIDD